MAELRVELHEKQLEIYNCPAQNRVVAAGRQSGKSHLAVADSIIATLSDMSWTGMKIDHRHETAYIYPTFEQGKKVVWPRLKHSAMQVGAVAHENTGLLTFPNGRRLRLLGADNDQALRGYTWSYAVLDEYKDMLPTVWEEVVAPALMITGGRALFIGTPKGKNHFYDLWKKAKELEDAGDPAWAAFTFTSAANPAITEKSLKATTAKMSSQLIRQEIEANFLSQGGSIFKPDWFLEDDEEPKNGEWIVAADLAGFTKSGTGRSADYSRRDETAIAVVKVHSKGWWVKEIRHGRWEVRETALQILSSAKSVQAARIGIEKGTTLGAISGYLTDLMRSYNRWLDIVPLTHGNRDKRDRIQWALQGRAERGQITLNLGGWRNTDLNVSWQSRLLDQASDFPDPRSHDDLLDALAYVDQMATNVALEEFEYSDPWRPLDPISGY